MPSRILPIASKIMEAKFSSVAVITVLISLTSISAWLGSFTSTTEAFSDSEPLLAFRRVHLMPLLDNTVKSLSKSGEPQCTSGLISEDDCTFLEINRCLPCSLKSSPFNLVILIFPCFKFLQSKWKVKSVAISSSVLSFKLGICNVSSMQ